MIVSDDASVQIPVSSVSKRAELVVFGIIVAVIWPVMAVAVVGGYGFLIWMSQLVFGPPGPPHQ
jgi:nitrate reductase NapE